MTPWQPNHLAIEPELCQQIIRRELNMSLALMLVNETVDIVQMAILEMME